MTPKSYVIAALIALAVAVWMASGYLAGDPRDAAAAAEEREQRPAMTVQVRETRAETIERRLESQGEALAERNVELRAEITGRVVDVPVAQGTQVEEGDVLVRLAMNDRQARLDQAEALVAQRETDYSAAKRLGSQGYQARTRVREAFAALQSARAERAAIREEIANTEIRAPFDGVFDERAVEIGDYLAPGDAVGELVDNDPLKVSVNVAQGEVQALDIGAESSVALATGETLSGKVTYIASAADRDTRTFRVEVTAPNPKGLPSGVSATVRIPLGRIAAHFLSPALFTLDESGVLGAKTVTANGEVRFHPVKVVRTEPSGVWVTGLPDPARLITIGQGFVQTGERVRTVTEEASGLSLAPASDEPPIPGEATEDSADGWQ